MNQNLLRSAEMKNKYSACLLERYPSIWKGVSSECANAGASALWMLYAANYLFRTGTVRWAVDPVYSAHFIDVPENVAEDLSFLDLVLLSHLHADHCDLKLLAQLCRNEKLVMTIPEHMVERVLPNLGTPKCDIRIVRPGDTVEVQGLRATAFESLHFDETTYNGEKFGCDETGWLVEVDEMRILMPGDVRDYSMNRKLPDFGHIDLLLAHLWLGRGKALNFSEEDLIRFIDFVASFDADKACIAHLNEISREPEDYWTLAHAGLIMHHALSKFPEIRFNPLVTGEKMCLC